MSERQKEQNQGLSYEVTTNGDVIAISGTREQLIEIGVGLYQKLRGRDNEHTEEQAREQLRNDNELRPRYMAISIIAGKLYLDTRNFRGHPENRKMILDAVREVIG